MNIIFIFASGILLSGCAGTAEYLRSQPVTHFPSAASIAVPENLDRLIKLHCMRDQTADYVDSGGGPTKECLYVSADASQLTKTLLPDAATSTRNSAISFLISLSDLNCSNYLQRAFANKAGLDFTKNLIGDVTTAVSAGTVFVSPQLSSALSVTNLVVGKGVETFNSSYYFDKTFQALESAIMAQRIRVKTYIMAKQLRVNSPGSVDNYDMSQALSDIRLYDDSCSIKAGLSQLVQLADSQKQSDQKNGIKVELSGNPFETAKKLLLDSRSPALK
ncbi:hypothetical protein [Janthinobacterium sp. SUN137]|uniref:hypothetical protein n=1 Tax=Janthinobacterium sp. SUN137 TaxID=3014789 RepID=UPI00271243E7|nr:hypothetical protein [Janthinobacterium sp. SUN137]MDO8040312.1 hypothetical protein [Janthinobacterium sp. SUN137]